MARIRSIKIGFFQNDQLVKLSAHHRLLFAGLWLIADKAGRLEDRPARIKAELFPYEDLDIDQRLADLAAAGFIRRYVVRGAALISIPAFAEHQHPHHKEPESNLPPPPVERRKVPRPTGGGTPQASSKDASSIPDQNGPDPLGSGSGLGHGNRSGSGNGSGHGRGHGDARVHDEPASPKCEAASPHPTNVNPHGRTDTLINGAENRHHGSHAWCSWPVRRGLCVPVFLHDEFLGKSRRPDAELRAWYTATVARFADTAIGEDALVFWRREFAAWIGLASAAPARGRSRGTTPVDATKYAGLTEGDDHAD